MRVRSSAPSRRRRGGGAAITTLALGTAFLFAGCSREAPEVREVRRAAEDYFRALKDRDVKQIADRSTCLVSANSLAGTRVLSVEPPRRVREGTIDSLAQVSVYVQRAADSTWAYAKDATADSLFRVARAVSVRGSVYRNAARAMILSSPGRTASSDSTLESRVVRARFRYSGAVIGPKPIDREQIVRLLRVPGGKWIVFSVYVTEADPAPDPL